MLNFTLEQLQSDSNITLGLFQQTNAIFVSLTFNSNFILYKQPPLNSEITNIFIDHKIYKFVNDSYAENPNNLTLCFRLDHEANNLHDILDLVKEFNIVNYEEFIKGICNLKKRY